MRTWVEWFSEVSTDIWHFVWHIQSWICLGGIKYHRSLRSQSNILFICVSVLWHLRLFPQVIWQSWFTVMQLIMNNHANRAVLLHMHVTVYSCKEAILTGMHQSDPHVGSWILNQVLVTKGGFNLTGLCNSCQCFSVFTNTGKIVHFCFLEPK